MAEQPLNLNSSTAMKSVLIIDDEEDIGHLMMSMLSREGYTVKYASTATRARELLKENEFHTILLDLHLGEEQGLNLLGDIGESQRDPHIVVITAYDEPIIRKKVAKAGIHDFIPKPFKKSQVLELIA